MLVHLLPSLFVHLHCVLAWSTPVLSEDPPLLAGIVRRLHVAIGRSGPAGDIFFDLPRPLGPRAVNLGRVGPPWWPSTVRSDECPAWFSFWFSGRWRALAKGTAWADFFGGNSSSSSPEASSVITGSIPVLWKVGYLCDKGQRGERLIVEFLQLYYQKSRSARLWRALKFTALEVPL